MEVPRCFNKTSGYDGGLERLRTTTFMAMQYTPQQVMSTVGISQQTLRYWRKVLPPLEHRDGYTPCFSFADMLALKVVFQLTSVGGVAIGTVSSLAQAIFDACALNAPLATSHDATLIVCPGTGKVIRAHSDVSRITEDLEFVIPLGRCLAELFEALQGSSVATPQIALPLPLAAVGKQGNRAG